MKYAVVIFLVCVLSVSAQRERPWSPWNMFSKAGYYNKERSGDFKLADDHLDDRLASRAGKTSTEDYERDYAPSSHPSSSEYAEASGYGGSGGYSGGGGYGGGGGGYGYDTQQQPQRKSGYGDKYGHDNFETPFTYKQKRGIEAFRPSPLLYSESITTTVAPKLYLMPPVQFLPQTPSFTSPSAGLSGPPQRKSSQPSVITAQSKVSFNVNPRPISFNPPVLPPSLKLARSVGAVVATERTLNTRQITTDAGKEILQSLNSFGSATPYTGGSVRRQDYAPADVIPPAGNAGVGTASAMSGGNFGSNYGSSYGSFGNNYGSSYSNYGNNMGSNMVSGANGYGYPSGYGQPGGYGYGRYRKYRPYGKQKLYYKGSGRPAGYAPTYGYNGYNGQVYGSNYGNYDGSYDFDYSDGVEYFTQPFKVFWKLTTKPWKDAWKFVFPETGYSKFKGYEKHYGRRKRATGEEEEMTHQLSFPILKMIAANGFESMEDSECQKKYLCDIISFGDKPEANALQKSLWYLSSLFPDQIAEVLGVGSVQTLLKNARSGNCNLYSCKRKQLKSKISKA